MKAIFLLNLALIPFLVSAVVITYDPVVITNATMIKQVQFMFSNETAPSRGEPGNGENYIEVQFKASKGPEATESRGIFELLVVSDSVFGTIGYDDNGTHYDCCDDQALEEKRCMNHNRLLIFSNETKMMARKDFTFSNQPITGSVKYNVPKEGKYYVIVAVCDPDVKNLKLEGTATIMNPYGHIPARLYGILPFTKLVLVIYTILMFVWIIRCCWYRKELMSVHLMITIVLGIFLFDMIAKLVNLVNYNSEGTYTRSIALFSLITTSATHTVARCLTIMVAMGLGVSKASLSGTLWKIIFMGTLYFCLTLWDSIATTFSTTSEVNLWRIIPVSLLDSIIYFWILQSLLDTIQELEDKKQTGKLDVFIKLRNMIIVAIIISTLYNVFFSYLIMEGIVESLWKYQWFFNDGIWTSFYLLVIVVIMYLWAPNERSLAYAYHTQISAEEHQDTEEYNMQEPEQLVGAEGSVQVTTVEATEDNLKPMGIKQGTAI